jgi:hypothetical protein
VLIEHNTAFNSGHAVMSNVGSNRGFVCRNNIFRRDVGSGLLPGDATLKRFFPGSVWTRNVQIGADWSVYNSSRGNFFPTTTTAVGFVDFERGNYRLAPDSKYKNAATDGKDIGCDFDTLAAAQGKSK